MLLLNNFTCYDITIHKEEKALGGGNNMSALPDRLGEVLGEEIYKREDNNLVQ
ncbi:hypothetical protein [Psychrobacillus lasiicapitis]|uniref:hypothetical protein n=1 Tax=Psychrobacillus lasiicapitis TaxID=1636719 RepID=UPI00188C86C5|nr:hypothetical protein GCM10011384_24360 [Psychrobacillus lasiicapitis]